METPTLPKGYFFEVIPGTFYVNSSRDIPPKVLIKKRVWLFWSTTEYTVQLTKVVAPHPTPEHVHRGMLTAKEGWEESVEKSKVYGQYPPSKLKEIKNGK